ncbi:hypothetical protein [Cellulomonas sp. Marseille-Q8402]
MPRPTALPRRVPRVHLAPVSAAGRRVARFLARAPGVARALRATAAAVLAWLLVGLVPGPWSDYPYYAPLGAVIATAVTVRGSTLRSAQTVLGIALGAVIARVTDALPVPAIAGLAVVVLVGVLVSEWRVLGDMGSWVPTAALFVLIIGDSDPVGYVSAYVGLTLAGALVGVGVNLVLPPLPLTPADHALLRLRDATADHLEASAAAVRENQAELPSTTTLLAARTAASGAVASAREAARGNWTAQRYRTWRERQDRYAGALDGAAAAALDVRRAVQTSRTVAAGTASDGAELPAAVTALVADADGDGTVREATAAAIEAAAALVRSRPEDGTDEDAAAALSDALAAVQTAVAADRDQVSGASRPADAVLVALAPLLTR